MPEFCSTVLGGSPCSRKSVGGAGNVKVHEFVTYADFGKARKCMTQIGLMHASKVYDAYRPVKASKDNDA